MEINEGKKYGCEDLLYVSYFMQCLSLRCQCSDYFINTQLSYEQWLNEHRDIQSDVKTFRSYIKTANNINARHHFSLYWLLYIFLGMFEIDDIHNWLPFDDNI